MTDDVNPKPITRKRPMRYPRSLSVLVTEDVYQAIAAEADDAGVSKGTIARRYLEIGHRALHPGTH